MNYHRPVILGGVTLPGNLFFAPVAGYSDAAFRSLCVDEGADLCYTEMVSSEALVRDHPKTASLLERAENERAYAIQLFGSKPKVMALAAERAAAVRPLLIDVNCGCPVPKIVKSGSGSALVRKPELIGEIVGAMVSALAGSGIPVTVKVRSGWDAQSVNYPDTARAAVEAGAAAVTLHARTRAQGYSGLADWSHIATLARSLPVPVFGSGDVFSGADAARMIAETSCAGVMIARGAIGNPFIFRSALAALEGRDIPPPSAHERATAARRHLELSARFLGERTACVEFRKHFCAYTKGTAGGAELRAEAVRASSLVAFFDLLERWLGFAEA
ncbi:MAG: tRNA dihydrouridine synthase DusB [Spirochaetaceae bacterium]|nr:tRNA dihydrouridine synthase DusB [Spirochaetaceae bacterium]